MAVRGVVLALVVLVAVGAGLLLRARNGRARAVSGVWMGEVDLGSQATFVQFSSPVCRYCAGVRRVLGDLADGSAVKHVEIDASERLDLAKELGIMRTPTVLVLDPAGAVVSRASGPMTAAQARAALSWS